MVCRKMTLSWLPKLMKFMFDIKKTEIAIKSKVVYYDASCNLCISVVKVLKKFDGSNAFDFIPNQFLSKTPDLEDTRSGLKTIILNDNNKIYTKSNAVLRILKNLKQPISWLYIFIIIPRFIRDGLYDFIARNRYHWFGRCNACEVDGVC